MKTLEQVFRWVVILGIFLLPFVPLVVANSLFFPFITGKNFMFRIVVEVITGVWLALALVFPQYRPKRSWILGAFALFVIIMAIADAQGVNPLKSFWSNFERMDGWITIAHLLCYTVVASAMLSSEDMWRNLFKTSLAVSVYLSGVGLAQVLGIVSLGQASGTGLSARVDATFGNPIYLAAYMLFNIFIAALLWSQMWMVRKPGKRTWPSVVYGIIIALDTFTLLLTETRGTILGLIAGIFVSAFVVVYLAKNSRVAWRMAAFSVGVVLIGAGGLYALRDTSLVNNVGFLHRLATISLQDNTTIARLINMQTAFKGFEERPLLGWGQENFAIVFDKFYDPRMYAQEPWFDRVHNIIFDWLIAGGILGLAAYLSIFFAALSALWRSNAFTIPERSIFTGLFLGYFIHNFFVFDNVTSYILFGTILAYLVWRAGSVNKTPTVLESVTVPVASFPVAIAAAIFVVWWGAWSINASALAANKDIIVGITPSTNLGTNLEALQAAIAEHSYGDQEAREQLAQAATQIINAQGISLEAKQAFYTTAISEMQKQAQVSPLDARFPLFVGLLEDSAGNYTDAQASLAQARALSPKKQSIIFEQALNAQARKDEAAALGFFKEAYELDPSYTDARVMYVAELIKMGNEAAAQPLMEPLFSTGVAADPRIAAAYAARKEYSTIISIWTNHIAEMPSDLQAYFTLAGAYYEAGQKNQAVATLRAAEKISPAVTTQAESAIAQILGTSH